MESILTSVKKLLGITEEYTHFDEDIIMHTNAVFMILVQMGVGPSNGFSISDSSAVWTDFLSDDHWFFHSIKTYVGAKVRLIFDPPQSSTHKEALQRTIDELEWRLNFAAENGDSGGSYDPGATGPFDYNELKNKPSINGEILIGNYNEKDPTVKNMPSSDVDDIWKTVFDE